MDDHESSEEASSGEEDDDESGTEWSELAADELDDPEFAVDIITPIKKVSKIVTLFRKSPKLWERLLNRTEAELTDDRGELIGKRLGLIRQCKTRWNTMFQMNKRFYLVRDKSQYLIEKVL